MDFPERLVAVALIQSSDEQIVMGQKWPDANGAYAGQLVLPGGFVETGETPKGAIFRETSEEVGLDITAFHVRILDDDRWDDTKIPLLSEEVVCRRLKFITYMVYTGRPTSSVWLRASDEFQYAKWFPIAELGNYTADICEPSLELFNRLGWLALSAPRRRAG